jgi:hypothetical protein
LTGTHYTLEVPVRPPPPAGVNEVSVQITFTDAASGATITRQQPVRIKGSSAIAR